MNPFLEPEIEIPSLIKNNAAWWADGAIDDECICSGLQYLINEGIMKFLQLNQENLLDQEIPSWIKNNAAWWAG